MSIARSSGARFQICAGARFEVTRYCGRRRVWQEHAAGTSDELLLDLGVWIGWSTRLTSDASDRTVYGFDTFEGLVEDWQIDDQTSSNEERSH